MIRNEDNARVSTLYELAKSSLRLFDVFTAVKMKVGEKYKSYTYERLFEDAASIGRALRRRKLTSKHVIIFGNNSYDWVRAYFAVGAHCGTVLPLPLRLSADELADAAKRCDACAIIYDDAEKVKDGLVMIAKSVEATLEKLGVEAVGAVGDKFDPNLHNAVMHVDDEAYGENEIIEVFQKGYKKGARIIRFAMVKTAN